MSFKEFIKELNGNGAEGKLIKTVFISLATSFILLCILYFLKLRYIENFIPKYGFYLFLAILSYALIMPSIKHVRAYKEFSCMSGMMIGMTIGMVAGFLHPVIAEIAMALSSITVVTNANLLRKKKI